MKDTLNTAIQDLKMMIRVGIEEFKQEQQSGVDEHSQDLANLQDMLHTIQTFQKEKTTTPLQAQAVLCEVLSHSSQMDSDILGHAKMDEPLKQLKGTIKKQMGEKLEAGNLNDKDLRVLGTLARLDTASFNELVGGNTTKLQDAVEQNFDKFSDEEKMNLAVKLLPSSSQDGQVTTTEGGAPA